MPRPSDTIWIDCNPHKAKPHPWKKVPEDSYAQACETLNQIIDIG